MSETTVGTFRVLDPREEARPKVVDLAPRLSDLNGKVVGFLDISKSKGDIFLRQVEKLLTEKYHFAEIIRRRKPTFAKPAPKEIYDELIEKCDIVIEALADWGSCTTCSVHDGVTFEKNGIPSAVITTTEFVNAAKIQADALGMPQFSVITVPHPIQNLTFEEVNARAEGIVEKIVAKLSHFS